MKAALSLLLALSTGLLAASLSESEFEKRFLAHFQTNNTAAVRLVGYKTVYIPEAEVAEFDGHWDSGKAEWADRRKDEYTYFSHVYYDRPQRSLRLYFPVEGALMVHGDQVVEADETGQLPPHVGHVDGNCHVLGRKQTDSVHGVHGNVIKDGVVYLGMPNAPVRQHGTAYVYDFGLKEVHDHSHHSELLRRGDGSGEQTDSGKGPHDARRSAKAAMRAALAKRVEAPADGAAEGAGEGSVDGNGDSSEEQKNQGCVANHGGINCSKAYHISFGRCTMNPSTCMDYNGPITDCKKGTSHRWGIPTLSKTVKFVGSDCSAAVALGHCWNEVR